MLDSTKTSTGAASFNAADWFVDRHLREGNGARPAFIEGERTLSYGGLQGADGAIRGRVGRGGGAAGGPGGAAAA